MGTKLIKKSSTKTLENAVKMHSYWYMQGI